MLFDTFLPSLSCPSYPVFPCPVRVWPIGDEEVINSASEFGIDLRERRGSETDVTAGWWVCFVDEGWEGHAKWFVTRFVRHGILLCPAEACRCLVFASFSMGFASIFGVYSLNVLLRLEKTPGGGERGEGRFP